MRVLSMRLEEIPAAFLYRLMTLSAPSAAMDPGTMAASNTASKTIGALFMNNPRAPSNKRMQVQDRNCKVLAGRVNRGCRVRNFSLISIGIIDYNRDELTAQAVRRTRGALPLHTAPFQYASPRGEFSWRFRSSIQGLKEEVYQSSQACSLTRLCGLTALESRKRREAGFW